MLEETQSASSFSLESHKGTTVSLDDFKGQWVVLYFFPRADTPGCTTEACEFRDAWSDFTDVDAVVLGVSDDPVADLQKFSEKYDLPFTLLSDEDGDVARQYDSYGEKNVFGNTVQGVYRNTYLIDPTGEIVGAFANVSPEGHAHEVLEVIESED